MPKRRPSSETGDLFESALEDRFDEFAPLAARMRPRTLDEFVGQSHVIGPGSPLRSLVENDNPASMILWGPPGTGKTTIASIVAKLTRSRYQELSAVSASVSDVRRVISEAREALAGTGRKTILFLDEIHRFNKSQQDALLPSVENRWVILIGATTENPYFEVVSPLMSRCMLFRLEMLSPEEIMVILRRALEDSERGLGDLDVTVEDAALDHIVATAGGDARASLNSLEVCVAAAGAAGSAVTLQLAEETLQKRQVRYDKQGDVHYDVISAFIKSMRGSDPDASLFWLAKMLEAGEDARFIARRMVIFASEDVGNADPLALVVAVSAFHALEFVGLPEAALNLAHAATYLASAPKSNASTVALGRATKDVELAGNAEVPGHLSGSPGRSKGPGYKYPHDFPGAWVEQQYRPKVVDGNVYYEPTDRGAEADIAERLGKLRGTRRDERN